MIYLALLRGINVGGHNKVEMSRLKTCFEKLGLADVKTYINSGNIIFSNAKFSATELDEVIEKAIKEEFSFDVPVVVRTAKNIQTVAKAIPADWANDIKQKADVLFLREEINNIDILKKIIIDPEIENVLYLPGALVWNIARENVAKGNGIKLIGTTIYKQMTARNVNTVRKLAELMG